MLHMLAALHFHLLLLLWLLLLLLEITNNGAKIFQLLCFALLHTHTHTEACKHTQHTYTHVHEMKTKLQVKEIVVVYFKVPNA